MTSNANQQHQPSSAAGFSLVEVLMQLGLLITVTVPLLMMLNSQEQQMNSSRNSIAEQVFVNQLFDNVILQHPDPIDAFTISSLTSLYCDPATKMIKDADEYSSTCGVSDMGEPGSDMAKGPFFTRDLAFDNGNSSNGYRSLKITVKLYKSKTSGTPYYQLSRAYNLDSFRIRMGEMVSQYTLSNDFAAKITTDASGNPWYPVFYAGSSSPDASTEDDSSWYVMRMGTNSCVLSYPSASDTTLEVPFNKYMTFNSTGCLNGIASHFRNLVGGETYSVQFYFMPPSGNSSTSCLANTTGLSCNMADIGIEATDSGGTVYSLQSYKNLDLTTYGGGLGVAGRGVIVRSEITMPQNARVLKISLKPTALAGVTTAVYLSGIEIIRRPES